MNFDRDGTALAAFIVGTVLAGGNAVGVSCTQPIGTGGSASDGVSTRS
jgi:hypothetical protein